jgi:SAM-dependent methyltransferase
LELLLNTHPGLEVSAWVRRWAPLIAPRGRVLDVACGSGRHLRWLAERGHSVTGLDRDAQALMPLESIGRVVVADIENNAWPLPDETFDGIVVTNYLWRPLLATMVAAVSPGGVLIYETFAVGNKRFGKPSNPDFLLQPGELLRVCAALHVVAYEDGVLDDPPRRIQRIAAQRQPQEAAPLESRKC